jgi:hypothetical protein
MIGMFFVVGGFLFPSFSYADVYFDGNTPDFGSLYVDGANSDLAPYPLNVYFEWDTVGIDSFTASTFSDFSCTGVEKTYDNSRLDFSSNVGVLVFDYNRQFLLSYSSLISSVRIQTFDVLDNTLDDVCFNFDPVLNIIDVTSLGSISTSSPAGSTSSPAEVFSFGFVTFSSILLFIISMCVTIYLWFLLF